MTYSSTINPAIPATGSPMASAPLRAQFAAAQTDINALASLIGTGGSSQPTTVLTPILTTDYLYVVRASVAYLATVASIMAATTPSTGGSTQSRFSANLILGVI